MGWCWPYREPATLHRSENAELLTIRSPGAVSDRTHTRVDGPETGASICMDSRDLIEVVLDSAAERLI